MISSPWKWSSVNFYASFKVSGISATGINCITWDCTPWNGEGNGISLYMCGESWKPKSLTPVANMPSRQTFTLDEAENVSFRKSATLLHGGFRHRDMPVCLYEVPGSSTSCLPTSGTSQGAQWMFSRFSWTNFYWLSQMSPKSQATLLRGGQIQIASLIWPVMPIPGIGWKCWMVTPQQWRLRYQRCCDIVVSKDLTR